MSKVPTNILFALQLTYGENPFLLEIPGNPFNGSSKVYMLGNGDAIPAEPVPSGIYGWVYRAHTKTIKLNWPGTDLKDKAYFDY